MTRFTFLPSSTNPVALGVRMEFESSAAVAAGVSFPPAGATFSGTWSLVLGSAAELSVDADANTGAFIFFGSCLVARSADNRFVVRSGRFRVKPSAAEWPNVVKTFLTANWGDPATVTELAIGSDGVQLEAVIDGTNRVYRWDPVFIADQNPVPRWLELRSAASPLSSPTIPADLNIQIVLPSGTVPVSASYRQQLLTDSGTTVFGTVDMPTFGLALLGREWFPLTMWQWADGASRFIEFVDVAPGRRHPGLADLEDLQVSWADAQTPSFTALPSLESTGRTTDGTFDLPAAWQFGGVAFKDKHAPGAWIHWRLIPFTGPSRLDVQVESLGSGLHGLWKLGDDGDDANNDWGIEFGLSPSLSGDRRDELSSDSPRIRLTIEIDAAAASSKATLIVSKPRVFAFSPRMRFFGRSLVDLESLPHAAQLGESLVEARVEFSGPISTGVPTAGQVKAKLTTGAFSLTAGPRAVEAWVPGPWAGLNAGSRTGANLVDPASLTELSEPIITRDRNQGLVDLPLSAFSLETAGKPVLIKLAGDFPIPTRTGPTVSALLPWVEWSVADDPLNPTNPVFSAYHRNLVLERFEHQAATSADAAPQSVPDPTGIMFRNGAAENSLPDLAIDQRLRELEVDRRIGLRDRFASVAQNLSSTTTAKVKNWFTSTADVTVKLDPGTESVCPALDWSINGSIKSRSQVQETTDILKADVRWIAAVDATNQVPPDLRPEFTAAADDTAGRGAEFRACNGHVPPVFRSTGIAQVDAAEIHFSEFGRVLVVVFVDQSQRTFVWVPDAWKEPRLLAGVPTGLNNIRLITKTLPENESFTLAAIVAGNVDTWEFSVFLDDVELLDVATVPTARRIVTGNVATLHVTMAALAGPAKPFLIVGVNDGSGDGRVLAFPGDGFAGPAEVFNLLFPGAPVRTLDFRNMVAVDPRTQVLLVGSTDKIHVVAWKNDISATPVFSSAPASPPRPGEQQIPFLRDSGKPLGSVALQGFDGGTPSAPIIRLHVWSISEPSTEARIRRWGLKLSMTETATAPLEPIDLSSRELMTGVVPAGRVRTGNVKQLAFGDRTEIASRFLVAVTQAGANGDSAWMRWEPEWNLATETAPLEDVPARSFFQLSAHRGGVLGASLVPLLTDKSAGDGAGEPAGYLLVTGGDDGAVIVRDAASGRELFRHEPRDWAADSLGCVRRVTGASPGQEVRAGGGQFTANQVFTTHQDSQGKFILLATGDDGDGDRPGIRLVEPSEGADLRMATGDLLLHSAVANRWDIVPPSADLPLALGSIAVFSNEDDNATDHAVIRRWPRIGGFPFHAVDASFEFEDTPFSPRPKTIRISGVLLNPTDLGDVSTDDVPTFVREALRAEDPFVIKIDLTYDGPSGAYRVDGVGGTFEWRFPLADQLPPLVAPRSIPGRLQSVQGEVEWVAASKKLRLKVDSRHSLGDALGKSWPLVEGADQTIDLELDPVAFKAGRLLLREVLVDFAGALVRRRAMPQIPGDSAVTVVEFGRDENKQLLALTATDNPAGDLFVAEFDTGRSVLRCRDRYRDGVLVRRNPFDSDENGAFDAVLVHTDGTVRVWPAVTSQDDASGDPVFAADVPRQELRRFQPDSLVDEVVVFDGMDVPPSGVPAHHRLYLFRCTDGSARLWDDLFGEIARFDLPDSVVTAIAIAPQLSELDYSVFRPLFAPDEADEAEASVITIVTLGGADGSVRSFLITTSLTDSLHKQLKTPRIAPFRQLFDKAGAISSVSIEIEPFGTNPNLPPTRKSVRLLACSRLGEKPTWIDLIDGRTETGTPMDTAAGLIRGRLIRSTDVLYIALEIAPVSAGAVHVSRRRSLSDFGPFIDVGNTGGISSLALVDLNSADVLLVAGGDQIRNVEIDVSSAPVALAAAANLPATTSRGNQAVSLGNCAAGRVLLAIDDVGLARLFTSGDVHPPLWSTPLGFGSQSSQPVVAATFAEIVVPVALRIAGDRVEIWDLDFESCRYVSQEALGVFRETDLPRLCFRILGGRPILVVGRFNAIEFWNLRTGRLEDRRLCAGEVTHLDVVVDDMSEPQIAVALETAATTTNPATYMIQEFKLDNPAVDLLASQPDPIERLTHFRGFKGWDVAAVLCKTGTGVADKYRVFYWPDSQPMREGKFDATSADTRLVQFDVIALTDSTHAGLIELRDNTNAVKSWTLNLHDAVIDVAATPADGLHTLRENLTAAPTSLNTASDLDGFPADSRVLATFVNSQLDRRVVRVVTDQSLLTWEIFPQPSPPSSPDVVISREHPLAVVTTLGNVNVRVDYVNWPAVVSVSKGSQIRIFDRLSGVLRQQRQAAVKDDATVLLDPLPKGLLGIAAGANPTLLAVGKNGVWSINFADGRIQVEQKSILNVALGWDPQSQKFPLAVAWAESGGLSTNLLATTRADFRLPLGASDSVAGTALENLFLWTKPMVPTSENPWHLSGVAGGNTKMFSFATAVFAFPAILGTVVAAAWPLKPQRQTRPRSSLRPDRGPDLDVERLLLAILDAGNLELRDVVLDDPSHISSRWRRDNHGGPVVLLADDLGIRFAATQTGATYALSPTPWLRVCEKLPPQFDLRVKCSADGGPFTGRITPDYHFEIDVAPKLLPGAIDALVARPSLVQGDAYAFLLESTIDSVDGFVRGAMVLRETPVVVPAPATPSVPTLNGLILWETIERNSDIMVVVPNLAGGTQTLEDARADLRSFWTAEVADSAVKGIEGRVSGIVRKNAAAAPNWELHLAEQPVGAAFAFLKQQGGKHSLEGFVPLAIKCDNSTSPSRWSLTADESLLAFAPKPVTTSDPRRGLPLVRDDVFYPFPSGRNTIQLVNGQVVDLFDTDAQVIGTERIGRLGPSLDNKNFAIHRLPANEPVPLDLLGGIAAAVVLPKEPVDVLQLVHRREHGGRLRADRNGTSPFSIEAAPDVMEDTANSYLVNPVALQADGARLLFESLSASPASSTSGGAGLGAMRTESVMTIATRQFATGPAPAVRNLLTTTAVAPMTAGLSTEIFFDQAVRSHAVQLGTTGVLLKRTLDEAAQVDYQFVNSPFHALEPQTLLHNGPAGLPADHGPIVVPLPQFVMPDAASHRQYAAPSAHPLLELMRPEEAAATPRTLRYRSEGLSVADSLWRIGVAEQTLFNDFDVFDEDDSPTVIPASTDSREFLPTDLTWQYGVDKPGAVLLHRLRGILPKSPNFVRTRPTDVVQREPQRLVKPASSSVDILQASFIANASFADVFDLTVKWSETLGSEPIGPLASDIGLSVDAAGIFKLVAAQPVFAIFQRFGERLIKVSSDAPDLLTTEPGEFRGLAPSETYLLANFDPFTAITPADLSTPQIPHIRWKTAAAETVEALSDYFEWKASVAVKLFREKSAGAFAKALYDKVNADPLTKWNIVWRSPSSTPADLPKLAAVFETDGNIRSVLADLQPARVAAVLRTTDLKPLFGTDRLEFTLFAGESASTAGIAADIHGDAAALQFRLAARAREVVGVSAPLAGAFVFLVKTLPTGESLAANLDCSSSS